MPDAEFDLKALCDRADVTPRTVHFYVQQGLLPPAGAPGPGARYGEGHVSRIKLIRLLQKQHLPLAEIARRLKGFNDQQVAALLKDTKARREKSRGSALDYIRGVLNEQGSIPSNRATRASLASASPLVEMSRASLGPPGPEGAESARSQWERFTLTDGIEVHVRRPLAREQQRQLDRILTAARKILGPEEEEQ
ncbi:MAG: MerR family transcriptional regulator [Acidobacteria bacterium]|nr:MerR family transcriptional regulator [Acidobacteriota bacterium]